MKRSTTSLEQYTALVKMSVEAAGRALSAFWTEAEGLPPADRRKALEAFWPSLVNRYGDEVAAIAADRFEEITGLDAVLGPPHDPDYVNSRLRERLDPLEERAAANPEDDGVSPDELASLLDEFIHGSGRNTTAASAQKHSLAIARDPGGPACAYCIMLASRGYVYGSEASALASGHPNCNCRLIVEGEDPGDYTPEKYLDIYNDAVAHSDSGELKDILAAMRERRHPLVTDRAAPPIKKELRELRKALTKDRENLGWREVVMTAEEQRAEMLGNYMRDDRFKGKDAEWWKHRAEEMEARLDALDALDEAIFNTPGITKMDKWPPELKELADAAGFGRHYPRNVLSKLAKARQAARDEARDARFTYEMAQHAVESVAKLSFKDQLVRRPDLTPNGLLGAESKKALDTVLRAGRLVNAELDAMTKAGIARGAAARRLLGELMDYGRGGRPKYEGGNAELLARMESAHKNYPTRWNNLAAKDVNLTLKEVDRGYYNYLSGTVALSKGNSVATHELGHHMEAHIPGLKPLEWAYHYQRSDKVTENGKTRLADPVLMYGDETAVPDKWGLEYSGKQYGGRPDSASEVFTVGVESVFCGSPYFRRKDYSDDVEYREFILGALALL